MCVHIHTYTHTYLCSVTSPGRAHDASWGHGLRPLILCQVDGVGRETEGGAGLLLETLLKSLATPIARARGRNNHRALSFEHPLWVQARAVSTGHNSDTQDPG